MAPPRHDFLRPAQQRPPGHGGMSGHRRKEEARRKEEGPQGLDSRELYEVTRVIEEYIKKPYESHLFPELWRNLPEIPSTDEIMAPLPDSVQTDDYDEQWDDYQKDPVVNPDLPHNIVDGAWPSKEEYIGAHYQILREDSIAPLRQSVALVKKTPNTLDTDNTCIYTHVALKGIQLSRIGAAFHVEFSYERAGKQIRWEQSKRLLQGSIVALSPMSDMFRTKCKVAVVAARPIEGGLDQNPPAIDLFLGDVDDAFIDPVEQYVMVESRRGYFEASRHMLVSLQKLMTESFKLQNHIVSRDQVIKAPTYLENHPYMNLSSLPIKDEDNQQVTPKNEPTGLETVDVLKEFPTSINSGMDESQMKACKAILTMRVAIIQGPPGTGKTFVSISALKVMAASLGPDDPPIIVAAQTNHALDQLLNHVLKFEPNIIRLGGRCDKANEEIVKRTLYNLRMNSGAPGGKALGQAWRSWADEIKKMHETLDLFKTPALIDSKLFLEHNFLSKDQVNSLKNSAEWEGENENLGDIGNWLTNSQMMQVPQTPSINIDLPMEEADIEAEMLAELEDEMKVEPEGPDAKDSNALGGEYFPFKRNITGRHTAPRILTDKQIKKMLASTPDLYEITVPMRGEIYRFLEKNVYRKVLGVFKDSLKKYDAMIKAYNVTKAVCNVRLIRHLGAKIIGCTTTGLSKYRGLLSALRPRSLLIEEAAETLEGKVMGGFMDSIEHLILVGDHKQLQASCTVPELLNEPYHMNISMFERLVNNGIGYVMLNTQRRMIPEVRKLLCIQPDPFYENLRDHPSVLDRVQNRPPVPGMGGLDTYFFHHTWPEATNAEFSRYNFSEADMVVRLFYYLCQNGVPSHKITILTFYNGQKKTILTQLRQHPGLQAIRFFNVFTVDSYQGEENDVILLSLVRSNTLLGIGFLESMNRLVVALSRARRGLYMFGNAITLASAEDSEDYAGRAPLWSPLIQHMHTRSRFNIDRGLFLTCERHGKVTEVCEPHDFDRVLAGGCDQPCEGGSLPCGHLCNELCHPYQHSEANCREPCSKFLACGHGCSRDCWEQCCCDACEIYAQNFVQDMQESLDFPGAHGYPEHNPVLYESPPRGHSLGSEDSFDGSSGKFKPRYAQPGMGPRGGSEPEPMIAAPSKMPRLASGSLQPRRGNFTTHSYTPRAPPDVNPWESWDVDKADANLAELRRLEDEGAPKPDPANLVFHETWRPTAVDHNGERVVISSISHQRTVGRTNVPPLGQAPSILGGLASGISNSASGLSISDTVPPVFAEGSEPHSQWILSTLRSPSNKPSTGDNRTFGFSSGNTLSEHTDDLLGLYDAPANEMDSFPLSHDPFGGPQLHANVTNKLITSDDENLIDFN